MNPPIVGAALWQQVVDRAGGRCQCVGECGGKHGPERCDRENGEHLGRVRLRAVPADPALPFHRAASLPAEQLHAICPTCHNGVENRRRNAAAAQPPQPDALFPAAP